MQRILRFLAPLALLLAAIALVACGGGGSSETGGKEVSSDDPNAILEQTFNGEDKKVESGQIDLSLTLDATGGGSTLNGPIDIKLSGPFQSQGMGKVPKFDIDLEFTGAGQNIKAGATSTGDKGFVAFNGQEYAVGDDVFKQFAQGYTQAQDQNKSSGGTLEELGITPQDWIQDAKVSDGSKVGDTETVKVSGGIDVANLLDDINTLLSKAGSLGIPNTGQLPSKLTEDQKQQVEDAVKTATVEIDTGKDDSILRRIALTLGIEDPGGSGGNADIEFDLSLTGLGEDQAISEPTDTKPLDQLLGQLGGLGGLGALGGAGSSGGSGSSGGVDSDAAAKYTQCVQDAGSDQTKLEKCSELLTP